MSPDDEAMELIRRYVDGLASAADARRLAELLRADATLRERYLEYLNVDLGLEDCAAGPATGLRVKRPLRRPRWRSVLGLAAAIAVVLTVAIWSVPRRSKEGGSPSALMAEVLAADRVQWADQRTPPAPGTLIEADRIHILHGQLTLRLDSGVVLELLGPADAAFETPMRLRLSKGRLNADVGNKGQGFTVATAAGDVIDLGTRFAVDVTAVGETKAAVFSGQVRIESGAGPGTSWSLREGEAVRFAKGKPPGRLPSLVLGRLGNLPAEANPASVVTGVSDNVGDADFRQFYAVIPGGLADGAPAYTDNNKQCWRALPGAAFPTALLGADLVCPFQEDRHALDLKLTVVLSQPAVVYVIRDTRKPPPEWLARDYLDTGMRLRSGPWRAEGKVVQGVQPDEAGKHFLHYSVWRKEVPVAGAVELGPPHLRGQGGPSAMYGIAVQPLVKPVANAIEP